MRKWLILVIIYLLVIYFSFQNRDVFFYWLNESNISHLPFMFVISLFLALFPVIPFTLFAGVMGAKYGMFLGGLVNWFGAATAAMIFFFMARYTFANYFRNYIMNYKSLNKFNAMIERNAFIAVLLGRLIPIVPTPVINIYSGLSKMPFRTYMWATIIGQIPSMFIFAFSGDQVFSSLQTLILGLCIYVVFILTVLFVYRKWFKGKAKAA
ncbi:TVP38/TMEM64 family protein [Anaerobacillus sp. MEB173]|uniref:TVP38/TMEM64 family protein n=1 Tax=Anaerobacillus sp. MEB173 TaxID=3383345 RepID=UPI003F911D00